jgi:hypothetical protein
MTRPLSIFTVPAELVAPVEPGSDRLILRIGIIELTPGEEMMAIRRSENELVRMAAEQSKESLRFVFVGAKDTPKEKQTPLALSTGDASLERVWATMPPALRTLVVTAYGVVNQPAKEAIQGFLASREVVSG